jgi:hypothetical protein
MGQPLVLSRASSCRQGGLAGRKTRIELARTMARHAYPATSRWIGVLAFAIAASWSKSSSIEDGQPNEPFDVDYCSLDPWSRLHAPRRHR